jgi:two-component system sensor histidine kinase UhpB
MNEISVLIVEDSFYSADLNVRELKKAGFTIRHQLVSSGQSMQNALKEGKWDLIISDNSMPNFSTLKALEIRNCVDTNVPFIIVSEDICQRDIDRAFEEGCTAYFAKENLTELRKVATDALRVKG